jgi:hypothetical protein
VQGTVGEIQKRSVRHDAKISALKGRVSILERPFNTQTHKRQTAFLLVAFSYLCIYTFDVEITSLESVGVKVTLPAMFAKTVLFWVSLYLFSRYFLDVLSELLFFTWLPTQKADASKWWGMMSNNKRFRELLQSDISEFTVRQLASFKKPTHQDATLMCTKLEALLRSEDEGANSEKVKEAIEHVHDAKEHLLYVCRRDGLRARWNLFRTAIGIVPFLGVLVFDILMPILVFDAVLSVAYGEPFWLKYENLQWWFSA